jgi:hypothetical protein
MTIGMIWHGGSPTEKQSEIEFDQVHAKRPCIENQLFRGEAFREAASKVAEETSGSYWSLNANRWSNR